MPGNSSLCEQVTLGFSLFFGEEFHRPVVRDEDRQCTQGVQNINPSHVLSGASQLMSFPCLNVECSLLERVAHINQLVFVQGQFVPLDLSLDTLQQLHQDFTLWARLVMCMVKCCWNGFLLRCSVHRCYSDQQQQRTRTRASVGIKRMCLYLDSSHTELKFMHTHSYNNYYYYLNSAFHSSQTVPDACNCTCGWNPQLAFAGDWQYILLIFFYSITS